MTPTSKTVFIASIVTETNTFSPIPTGMATWEVEGLFRRNASLEDPDGIGCDLLCFRNLAEKDAFNVVESVCVHAQPGAPTSKSIYEMFRGQIIDDLKAAQGVAIILLSLHGAMIAEGYDDCEGDLIEKMRHIVGPDVVIGVELDPHCHLTDRMVSNADAIIIMKEYPHVDFAPRATELYTICKSAAEGRIRPVSAMFDCRMVGFYPTMTEPMAGLVRQLCEAERENGILSISLAHGFPWGDQAEAGTRVLVIADNDVELAGATAERMGRTIYAAREGLLPQMPDIEEALEKAAMLDGLVVLADTADNAGGGAPGDSTYLLEALIEAKLGPSAFGTIYDPVAVRLCQEAGEGAELMLRIGGKLGHSSGQPLDLLARVVALKPDHVQSGLGKCHPLGDSAWISVGSVDIVLASHRSQVFGTDAFTGIGIDLRAKSIVALKSSEHFRASFQTIADHIIPVATPGAIQMDFATIPYRHKRDMGFFPRTSDPLGIDPGN